MLGHAVPLPRRPDRCRGASGCTQLVSPQELYQRNGLQFLPFNTLYQLAVDPAARARRPDPADPGPDRVVAEWSIGHRTHQRVDHRAARRPRPGSGTSELIDDLGLPRGIFTELVDPGERARPGAARRPATQIGADLEVLAVGSHDTASAVVGVPIAVRRLGVHLLRHLGAGRRRARAPGAHRGQPAGQVHQRARGRRADPVPDQRDGPVAAQRVGPRTGSSRGAGRPAGAARAGRRRGGPGRGVRRPGRALPAAR